MKFIQGAMWPGARSDAKWERLLKAVSNLVVDGETLAVELDNEDQIDPARKAAQKFSIDILRCRESSWRLQSTRRGNTLFLRKVRS